MARRKAEGVATTTDMFVEDLIDSMNSKATSSKAVYQGEQAGRTFGVFIPTLAFSWMIGGSTVIPSQRVITVSGLPKSFKSTLNIEIGNWFIMSNGVHVQVDTENKTSPTMLDAMTWKHPDERVSGGRRRSFKPASSIDEWQSMVTENIKKARSVASLPKGSRIPLLVTVDSLSANTTEDKQANLIKEGSAQARDYPVEAMQTAQYLRAMQLTDTTMNVSFVQHLMQDISAQGGYGGPKFREKGAAGAAFATSLGVIAKKGAEFIVAEHDGAPVKGPPVEGVTLFLEAIRGCLGPDGRKLSVDVLWQYIRNPDGTKRQVMWYDWYGALGRMLRDWKYSDKVKKFAYELEELDTALLFTQPKANRINCKELGLEEVSLYEFGKAIETNIEIRDRIQRYLGIAEFPTVQDADIDLVGTND